MQATLRLTTEDGQQQQQNLIQELAAKNEAMMIGQQQMKMLSNSK
jgi:hypothetical protein